MTGVRAGLCSVSFRGTRPAEIAALAAGASLAGIEWGADVHVPPGDESRAREVAALTADAGLECCSYGSYLFVDGELDRDPAKVLDTALALGAPHVRVWCPMGLGPADCDPDGRRSIVEAVERCALAAAARDLVVSLEFHPGTLTEDSGSCLTLLRSVAAPNLWTYWQPAPGTSVPAALSEWRAIRTQVTNLHVFWWAAGGRRLPLADGERVWPVVLDEARRSPGPLRERWALLEFVPNDDPALLAREADTLRRWLNE